MGEDKLERFLKEQVFLHPTTVDAQALWQKIQEKQKEKEKRRKVFWFWITGIMVVVVIAILGGGTYQSKRFNKTIEIEKESTSFEPQIEKINDSIVRGNGEKIRKGTATLDNKWSNTRPQLLHYTFETPKQESSIQLSSETYFPTYSTKTRETPSENKDIGTNKTLKSMVTKSKNVENKTLLSPILSIETKKFWVVDDEKASPLVQEYETSLIPILSDKKKYWKLSIGGYYHYGFSQRVLSASDDQFEGYQALRENTENSLDVARFGLDLRWKHKTGWYGKMGLEYQRITDRLNLSQSDTTNQLLDNQLVQIIKYVDGSTTNVYDTAMVKEVTTLGKKVYNRYHLMEYPLLLGYEKSLKSNWSLFFEAGASFNLLMTASGEIVDEQGSEYELSTDKYNWFKNRLGVALLANLGVNYHVNEHWRLWMSPAFKYHMSSFASTNNPLEQKYRNAGLSVGLRYVFE